MRNVIFPVLLTALMVMIFCFSAQPAEESSSVSSEVCEIAAKVIYEDYETWSVSTQQLVKEGLEFLVRKTAHFSEYALLGSLWYLYLYRRRRGMLFAFLASAGYAVTDEIHQMFVPGRSCELRDMLIDSSGACCGILVAFVLLCVIYCVRHGVLRASAEKAAS